MPRSSIKSMCKLCGARAIVKKYSSKGSNGKSYYYERYTHKNGVVHYFRVGKRAPRTDVTEAFEQMINSKVAYGNYRFRDLKTLFESVYGSAVNNTVVSRNIDKAIKMNLLEKKTWKNVTYYRKKDLSDLIEDAKVNDASLTYLVSDKRVLTTLFLCIKNQTSKSLTTIPIALPSGSSDSLEELDLIASDKDGRIDSNHLIATHVYPGQITISMSFSRPVKPSEKNFIFLQGNFEINEDSIKFALPLNAESFRISLNSNRIKDVHIRKRLLDGIKETNPDIIRRGTLQGGNSYTEVEFDNALKGEAIVVSW